MRKNLWRDIEIFEAFLNGVSVDELMKKHDICIQRLRQVIAGVCRQSCIITYTAGEKEENLSYDYTCLGILAQKDLWRRLFANYKAHCQKAQEEAQLLAANAKPKRVRRNHQPAKDVGMLTMTSLR